MITFDAKKAKEWYSSPDVSDGSRPTHDDPVIEGQLA